MPIIPDAYKKVPMMFQAQTAGRCQLQRIDPERTKRKEKQSVQIWTEEWIEKSDDQVPEFPATVQSKDYQISWRFVTNGGQDEGIIRPVMGAKGVPFYPGSSMKGCFRNACRIMAANKVNDYCGDADNPGILRFHGGYPTDDSWQEDLVDIVHPQQDWQVKTNQPGGAFALISLYQPELKFGISSVKTLAAAEWETIWKIWDRAVEEGLGCRVSSGYGQPQQQKANVIYKAFLRGQGIAPKVISGESEFRPNIFRAGIRGHALRIFGGLVDGRSAERLVENLFGGVTSGSTFGLLSMNWSDRQGYPILESFTKGRNEETYEVEGILRWRLTQTISDEEKKALTNLIKSLTRFAMLFGGFGKSWRRVHHDLFYEEYYEQTQAKSLIGCHWEWRAKSWNKFDLIVSPKQIPGFLNQVQKFAQEWMQLQKISPNPDRHADWREAWHKNNVQVWARIAEDNEDSMAVRWFHGAYRPGIREINQSEGTIYRTDLTGQMGKISGIWHRMYPLASKLKDKDEYRIRPNPKYIEILTIFPDRSNVCNQFLEFLNTEQSGFSQYW
jgi:CRISPR-associated protein Cmr6